MRCARGRRRLAGGWQVARRSRRRRLEHGFVDPAGVRVWLEPSVDGGGLSRLSAREGLDHVSANQPRVLDFRAGGRRCLDISVFPGIFHPIVWEICLRIYAVYQTLPGANRLFFQKWSLGTSLY
jgi:hypothetical protein